MNEAQTAGVEALALKTLFGGWCTVSEITEENMTDALHVYPYLMRAARFKAALNVREAGIGA